MNSCRKSLSQKKKKKKGVTQILGIHDTGVGNFMIMFKSRWEVISLPKVL